MNSPLRNALHLTQGFGFGTKCNNSLQTFKEIQLISYLARDENPSRMKKLVDTHSLYGWKNRMAQPRVEAEE